MNAITTISREEAQTLGLKRYFTGIPCVQGHLAERYVDRGNCAECAHAAVRKWNKKNPQKMQEAKRKHRGQVEAPTRGKPERCEMRGCYPGKNGLVEDHDHRTGKFRGWICKRCNAALGLFGDSREGLDAGISYLDKAYFNSISSSVDELKTAMLKFPQAELQTFHHWCDGIYMRVLPRPAGTLIVGKKHKKQHLYVVMQGTVLISNGAEAAREVSAPYVMVCEPGTKRAVLAKTDAICLTIHCTDERDLEKLEAQLVEPDSESPYLPGNLLQKVIR